MKRACTRLLQGAASSSACGAGPTVGLASAHTLRQTRARGCLSRCAVTLADKHFGRETRMRKAKQVSGDEEAVDVDEVLEEASEVRTQLKKTMRGLVHTLEKHIALQTALSRGGAAGIQAIVIDGQPITKLASISSQGLACTINVFHQVNVLKVKRAVEATDDAFQPSADMHPTTLKLMLPKMTGEKRERLSAVVRDAFGQCRKDMQSARVAATAPLKNRLAYIDQNLRNKVLEEIMQDEHEYSEKAKNTAHSAMETITKVDIQRPKGNDHH